MHQVMREKEKPKWKNKEEKENASEIPWSVPVRSSFCPSVCPDCLSRVEASPNE